MKVSTLRLKEGFILGEDIYCKSASPLMRRNTILSLKEITILKAFLIKDVVIDVPASLNNNATEVKKIINTTNTDELFYRSIEFYKSFFKLWEAGTPVDIIEVREKFLPLINELLEKDIKDVIGFFSNKVSEEQHIYYLPVYMCILSVFLGKKLKLSKGEIIQLSLGCLLSNIGFCKIIFKRDQSIFLQESEKEYKLHPVHSYRLLERIPFLRDDIKMSILQHQEYIDSTGYPFNLKGDRLQKYSTFIGIIDDYVKNLFIYNKGPYEALTLLYKQSFGKYDLKYITNLTEVIANYYIGLNVRLKNNQMGEIIYIPSNNITTPMIKLCNGHIIDLSKNVSIYIEEVFH